VSSIATAESLGTPTLVEIPLLFIAPASIASAEATGDLTFSPGGVSRVLVGIPTGEAHGVHIVAPDAFEAVLRSILVGEHQITFPRR
jgi:hypothetical protein